MTTGRDDALARVLAAVPGFRARPPLTAAQTSYRMRAAGCDLCGRAVDARWLLHVGRTRTADNHRYGWRLCDAELAAHARRLIGGSSGYIGVDPLPVPAVPRAAARAQVARAFTRALTQRWPALDVTVTAPRTRDELRAHSRGDSTGDHVRSAVCVGWVGGPAVGELINELAALTGDDPGTAPAAGWELISVRLGRYLVYPKRTSSAGESARGWLAALALHKGDPRDVPLRRLRTAVTSGALAAPPAEIPAALVDVTCGLAGLAPDRPAVWDQIFAVVELGLDPLEQLAGCGPAWRPDGAELARRWHLG